MVLPLQRTRFAQLGKDFYTELVPTPLSPEIQWGACNTVLAKELGLADNFFDIYEHRLALAGSLPPESYQPVPLASVYSGHQFGVWAGQLGDGRAILLGESVDIRGQYQEWQLKGAGRTPYSRFGDGRAVLRSSIREYLCSEAMFGLGIPTTRALALTVSPELVYREIPETAAVVTRIAPSFLRFGHLEHFFRRGQEKALKTLLDFVIETYYPELNVDIKGEMEAQDKGLDRTETGGVIYESLLNKIVQSTARLVAEWQCVGFCHGVMNTDNMSLLGLTIDYGPFGFLDAYDPKHISNHSDHQGRYAYDQQPYIAHWNLVRLANCFLPFVEKERLIAVLDTFPAQFESHYQERMRAKLGLQYEEPADAALVADLLASLAPLEVDFSLFFRYLAELKQEELLDVDLYQSKTRLANLMDKNKSVGDLQRCLRLYGHRLARENRSDEERQKAMNAVNPLYVLRNYLLQEAIEKAQEGDFSEIERLHRCMQNPFDEREEFATYAKLPPSWSREISVSCSS